jgi:hypothetical protein
MPDQTKNDKKNPILGDYLSRRKSAQVLRVAPATLDRLVDVLGIRTFQVPGHSRRWIKVPGHSRRWINRHDVEKLSAVAAGQEARA